MLDQGEPDLGISRHAPPILTAEVNARQTVMVEFEIQ
jgi:hypothetical protein